MLKLLLRLDAATLRELAVNAHCDPRTVGKVARGVPVRGSVARRAFAALKAAGFDPPEPNSTHTAGSAA